MFFIERESPMSGIADLVRDERSARVLLSLLAEPDSAATGRVLARVGAAATLRILDGDGAVPGLGRVDGRVWRSRLTARAGVDPLRDRLRRIERGGLTVLIPGDGQWPAAVNDLGARAPFALWVRGASSLLTRPCGDLVTVTGSRAATAYGEHVAGALAGDLASSGRVIVAGGAYGIEGAAHRAALAAGGLTIAVLAGGVDRPYPAGHRELLERVADAGLLVSEIPPGSPPTRYRFLARGRLLAALSTASVVVEAGGRSGSLLVAAEAARLDRAVGAVPGPVTSTASIGPHRLLSEGKARLISHADDIERLLATPAPSGPTGPAAAAFTRGVAAGRGGAGRSL